MKLSRNPAGQDDERGAVLVMVAFSMVAILAIAALVIDIGLLRSDRRANKSDADFAATAGIREMQEGGTWDAACQAFDYLQSQSSDYSGLAVTYEDGSGADITAGNPCTNPLYSGIACTAVNTTWARLHAESADASIIVDIQIPYDVSADASSAEESLIDDSDNGTPCEQLLVRVTEENPATFAGAFGGGSTSGTIRSVARMEVDSEHEQPAALILLERHDCNTLQTGGSNTRVIAQASFDPGPPAFNQPGIVQIDSAGDGDCNSQPIINGQATSSGPSIVACSTMSTVSGCSNPSATESLPSTMGVFAPLAGAPAGNVAPAFASGTYGDTEVLGTPVLGRLPVDLRYRSYVVDLDSTVRTLLPTTGTRAAPPGCGSVDPVSRTCTSAPAWMVISGADCDNATAAGLAVAAINVWFACGDYSVGAAMTLPVATTVVFNGALQLTQPLSAPVVERFYVYGDTSNGNPLGLNVDNGGLLALNHRGASSCASVSPSEANRLVVLHGAFRANGSTAGIRTCGTFTYLASGGNRVPATDGTAPCPSIDNSTPCDDYEGSITITANASVSWSAPNTQALPVCKPPFRVTGCYTHDDSTAFEDIALWSEASDGNVITGGGSTQMAGVYFLPNADEFELAGGGTLPIQLNAQFIVRKLKVTGGATVSLRPNPADSITIPTFDFHLVR